MKQKYNVNNITAASIEKYLLYNKWVRDYDFANKKMMVFHLGDDVIAIPASETYSDFYVSLPRLIDTLADIHEKSAMDIIKGINSAYHDMLEFRIKANVTSDGKLPLDYASECIDGLKDLILYSACAEQTKSPVCMRITNNARDLLNNFKLAQTEVGSFIINIDIKVIDEEEQYALPGIDVNSSIEHKVVKRIGNALKQIDDITKDMSKFDTILENAYLSGVTANMCEALMKLQLESPTAEIETKVRYATTYSENNNVETISIKGNHFYTINEIAKKYRENDSQMQVSTSGYITSLNKKKVDDVRSDRIIHAVTDINEGMRTVIAELCEDDYRLACDAHRDGEKVMISGILDMSKKIYRFLSVDEFKIIQE